MILLLVVSPKGKVTRLGSPPPPPPPLLSWLPLLSLGPYVRDLLYRLKIPRRPEWSTDMSPDILEQRERASFLEWRRDLAKYTILSHAAISLYIVCATSHSAPAALPFPCQLHIKSCCILQTACLNWPCTLLVCSPLKVAVQECSQSVCHQPPVAEVLTQSSCSCSSLSYTQTYEFGLCQTEFNYLQQRG